MTQSTSIIRYALTVIQNVVSLGEFYPIDRTDVEKCFKIACYSIMRDSVSVRPTVIL